MSWKMVAWIFIILFVLEGLVLISAYTYGTKAYNKKITCQNLCQEKHSFGFEYDSPTNTCSCYNQVAERIFSGVLP